ncbi:A/G-specific adenine glycosylase [Undibacterium flavidum]|uniref:Adenine DNA glycosylase n=1 Tax=Undibacterium flavidum TaxID=2762297 RepID=A0ABR6YB73_9BURK|nr:A/G-specific adenine glycosylase [Undibacterium flavidum]MBC3873874.1 A/G-specific adenine glycosylase [Undibacterium flavidum]
MKKKSVEVPNQGRQGSQHRQRSSASDSVYYDPSFSAALIGWQQQHGRHSLPWQNTGDAYKVWLSEIMLQQTQVTAVIPYYQRFLEKFPTVQTLAAAPVEEVMASWAGLGYYTRARNLHQCAKRVVDEYQGIFPSDPKLLQELPGIGRSTAAAVAAFSYGSVAAILDGNVKRVFARVFGVEAYPGVKAVEDDLWLRAEALLPTKDIGAYTQGLMDLGATLCTRSKPDCPRCPFQNRCIAHAQGRTAELPIRKPKIQQKEKHTVMLLLEHAGEVLLEQRPMTGIWGGLVSLPELDGMREGNHLSAHGIDVLISDASDTVPGSTPGTDSASSERDYMLSFVSSFGESVAARAFASFDHVFTHFRLHVHVIHFSLSQRHAMLGETRYAWTPMTQIEQLALPAPVKSLLLSHYQSLI